MYGGNTRAVKTGKKIPKNQNISYKTYELIKENLYAFRKCLVDIDFSYFVI